MASGKPSKKVEIEDDILDDDVEASEPIEDLEELDAGGVAIERNKVLNKVKALYLTYKELKEKTKGVSSKTDIDKADEARKKYEEELLKVSEEERKVIEEDRKNDPDFDDKYVHPETKKVISNPSIGAALIEASEEGDDELLEFLENLNIKAFRLKFGLLKRDLEKLTRKKSDAKKVRALLVELLGFDGVPTFKEYKGRAKKLKGIMLKVKGVITKKATVPKKTTADEKADELAALFEVADNLFEDTKVTIKGSGEKNIISEEGRDEYLEFIELTESPTITPKRILGATIVAGAASTVALTATLAAALTAGRWGIRKVGNTISFGADYIDELKLKAPFGELGDSMLRTVVDPLIDVKENTVNETKGAYNWVIEATKKWFGKKEEHPAAEHAPAGAAHGEHADDHAPAAAHAAPAATAHAPAHAPAHGAHGAGHGHAAESKPGMFSKLWSGTKNLASKAWSGTKNLAGNAWGVAKDLPRAAAFYASRAVMVPSAVIVGGAYGLGKGILYGARDFLGIKRREVGGAAPAPEAAPEAPAAPAPADGHDHGHGHGHAAPAAAPTPAAAPAAGDTKKEFFVEGGLVGSLFAAGSIFKELGWDGWRRTARHRADHAAAHAAAHAAPHVASGEHKGFNAHDIHRFTKAATKVVTDFDDEALTELGLASADLFGEKLGHLSIVGIEALMFLKKKFYPSEKSTLEEVDLDNIGKQISRLDAKDVNKWLGLLDVEDFVKEYKVLLSEKAILEKIASTPQGRAALKLKIKHLFGTDETHEYDGVETIEIKERLDSIKATFGEGDKAPKEKPKIRGKYDPKKTAFLDHLNKISGNLTEDLLKKIYIDEIKLAKEQAAAEAKKKADAEAEAKKKAEKEAAVKSATAALKHAEDEVKQIEEEVKKVETALKHPKDDADKAAKTHELEELNTKLKEAKKKQETAKHKLTELSA